MHIRVKATTGAKREAVVRKTKDRLDISVKEKPERNMANKRIMELVALAFRVPKGNVRIVSGHHSASKIFSVKGLTTDK